MADDLGVAELGNPRRRSASPRRSQSPPVAELPTRIKGSAGAGADAAGAERSGAQQPSVSIRVGGQDGEHDERSRGRGRREDEEEHQQQQIDGDGGGGDGDAEPMDEDDDLLVEDDGMGDMAAMMGFGGFGSTKGQKVRGNNVGAVSKEKKTEYRQYMNRVGGFNRPLSPSR